MESDWKCSNREGSKSNCGYGHRSMVLKRIVRRRCKPRCLPGVRRVLFLIHMRVRKANYDFKSEFAVACSRSTVEAFEAFVRGVRSERCGSTNLFQWLFKQKHCRTVIIEVHLTKRISSESPNWILIKVMETGFEPSGFKPHFKERNHLHYITRQDWVIFLDSLWLSTNENFDSLLLEQFRLKSNWSASTFRAQNGYSIGQLLKFLKLIVKFKLPIFRRSQIVLDLEWRFLI